VRQLYDNRASVNIQRLDFASLTTYARACAWTLARAHSRVGTSSELAGYMGKSAKFDEAISAYALAYRARNSQDYDALKRAVGEGRIISKS